MVFRDTEKRKKLESFTHPRIIEAFVGQLNEIVREDPDAIIQAVIPLMIESNLQHWFHKTLRLDLALEAAQVDRLVARDNITREEAARIIEAQLPIDEKKGYADFVIYNDNSLEDTRNQVERLWKQLKALQKERG